MKRHLRGRRVPWLSLRLWPVILSVLAQPCWQNKYGYLLLTGPRWISCAPLSHAAHKHLTIERRNLCFFSALWTAYNHQSICPGMCLFKNSVMALWKKPAYQTALALEKCGRLDKHLLQMFEAQGVWGSQLQKLWLVLCFYHVQWIMEQYGNRLDEQSAVVRLHQT